MADAITYTVDTAPILGAFRTVADRIQAATKAAAHETATAIAREATARVARRTGETQAGIHLEEDHAKTGYVVLATRHSQPNLPYWIEYGTKYMTKRPFLFVSAELEQYAHMQRLVAATERAIADHGLGA